MAEWWPFDRSWADEWKRNWTEVLNMSSAAAQSLGLPQPGILPGDPFTAIMDAARGWLIEKKRTFRFSGQDLTLVLSDLSVEGSDLGRVVGQYGQVRISARDVEWGGYQLGRMEIQARNVHLRPGVRPVLVVAPVLIEAFGAASAPSRCPSMRSQGRGALSRARVRGPPAAVSCRGGLRCGQESCSTAGSGTRRSPRSGRRWPAPMPRWSTGRPAPCFPACTSTTAT